MRHARRRYVVLVLFLVAVPLVLPGAPAHISDVTLTEIREGPNVVQTLELRIGVHAGGQFSVIVSTRQAVWAGVDFTHSTLGFDVLEGPSAELNTTFSFWARSGDLFQVAFNDLDGQDDTLVVRVSIRAINATGLWLNGTVTYGVSNVGEGPSDHGSASPEVRLWPDGDIDNDGIPDDEDDDMDGDGVPNAEEAAIDCGGNPLWDFQRNPNLRPGDHNYDGDRLTDEQECADPQGDPLDRQFPPVRIDEDGHGLNRTQQLSLFVLAFALGAGAIYAFARRKRK